MENQVQNTEKVSEVKEVRKDFEIPSVNLQTLQDKIAKLNRRCKRLKMPAINLTVGDKFQRMEMVQIGEKFDEVGNVIPVYEEQIVHYYKVEIVGASPRINGYVFIATVDHLPTGVNVFRTVEGYGVEEKFRHAGKICEHCNKQRNRKDTYILQADSGAQKQVGRSCLKDFLGHKSPEAIAAAMEYLRDAFDLAREYGESGGRVREDVDLETHISLVAKAVRLHGWCSNKTARENQGLQSSNNRARSDASEWLDAVKKNKNTDQYKPSDADSETAKKVIAWVRNLPEEKKKSEYMLNLCAVMSMDMISERNTGIAASALQAYYRDMEKEAEIYRKYLAQKDSQYVGELKKREVFELTLINTFSYTSQWGDGVIYKFQDAAGNVFAAYSLNRSIALTEALEGRRMLVKGTVVKHTEYKGVKQTVINRAVLEKLLDT